MHADRLSWATKDAAIVHELIALLNLSDKECALLAGLAEQAKAISPALIEDFYQRLLSQEATREFITDQKRLGESLATWFCELFGGVYDDTYALKRLNIGLIHVRIGLPVRYPLAMLDLIAHYGEEVAGQAGAEALTAFRKVLALDVATFNQAYENNQLQHLADLTGNERLARRLLSGG
ncbi:hypothetical protein J2T41_003278 [Pseudomonas citronellolis]|uniref:protoglobin domain-containing protein n=1 Tax=Pseudomonas citronellolis TaxID=53408 RepID=UPI00209F38B2|nr:protoglobin domain-containing protein [Pseudomonas citronellolis]MCP1643650.1 hypothetical protein [Pseudomonas citronellolis]MCP1666576.1 hypothetical protein [Pseudomonas citronellolis]MCP1697140.1 hypothetical protein [Pseudomonas citronellolis]MCP1704114.1 hypothetical protein [Pseudomonas citronellolis]MCP1798266.1 hypothetical protein [Pseudomonas citronellolis]